MVDFVKHYIFALLAAEMNFWACLLSGAGQGPDAQVWKSGLYTTPEGGVKVHTGAPSASHQDRDR